MLWGGRWEGGSCLGMHVRIKDFKNKNKNKNELWFLFCFLTFVHVQSLSRVRLSATPWTVVHPAPVRGPDFLAFSAMDPLRHRSFFFFFNFYFYFILLYNTVLVLPNIDMNPPRVYMRSKT